MKKKILLFLLLFIPFMINAEEKCTIVSGNGQDIGSEIECAGEHFYIVENKEDSVRMLAKYNLDIGYVFNKVPVSRSRFQELNSVCNYDFGSCDYFFEQPEFQGYSFYYDYSVYTNDIYEFLIYNEIGINDVKQSPKAIGAHGDESGNPEFPEYGVVKYDTTVLDYDDGDAYGGDYFYDYDLSDLKLYKYNNKEFSLDDYKSYLNGRGYNILNVNMLGVKDINSIINKISGKLLPLEKWGNEDNWTPIYNTYEVNEFWIIGSIKDYLPDGYDWLYSTTYFTKSYSARSSNYVYFVDTLGNLCNGYACNSALGAGIRPVVEISKDSINYSLTTKTDNNGVLETDKSHVVGDTIVLNATPKKGYKLEKLIVTTESGTTIEISGEDIIENEDGTISINPEVFTMPLENVVVEAKWQIINPKTGVTSFLGVMLLLLVISIGTLLYIMNSNKSYEL